MHHVLTVAITVGGHTWIMVRSDEPPVVRKSGVRGLVLPVGSHSVRNANGWRFLTVIKCILCFYLKE